MSRFVSLFIVSTLLVAVACSTTKTGGEKDTPDVPDSPYPDWYDAGGFQSDSLSFKSYSTAIAADSMRAANNAEMLAMAQLEQQVGNQLEEIRNELIEQGSDIAGYKEFILMLRNATNDLAHHAEATELQVDVSDEHYRGFAEVTMNRADIRQFLEDAFQQNSSYWNELSNAESFSEF